MRKKTMVRLLVMIGLVIAGVTDARAEGGAPAATAERALVGEAMQGPFASLAKLCASVSCARVGDGEGKLVPGSRACPQEGEDLKRMKDPPAPFTDVHLQPINCRAKGLRDGSLTYRLAARRADGWWLSRSLFTVGGNDKYCDGDVKTATWEARPLFAVGGKAVVLSATIHTECVACGKQGSEDLGLDLVVVLADVAGGRPAVFPPLVIGQHRHQEKLQDDVPDSECPPARYDLALRPSFGGDGRVDVDGAARWQAMAPPRVDAGYSAEWTRPLVKQPEPSTSGHWRLALPSPVPPAPAAPASSPKTTTHRR